MLTDPVKVGDRVREIEDRYPRIGAVVRVTESEPRVAYIVWDWDERWDVRRVDAPELATLKKD